MRSLDWKTDRIDHVDASMPFTAPGQFIGVKEVGNRRCMTGASLSVDVRDEYAYDIDEPVELMLEFDLSRTSSPVVVEYDRNGDAPAAINIELPPNNEQRQYRTTISLERARFAGLLSSIFARHADISIRTPPRLSNHAAAVTVCDIDVRRSYETSSPAPMGSLHISLVDERGVPVSARIGLYDSTGRMPLPGAAAMLVKQFTDTTRVVSQDTPWFTASHRQAFYIDGDYQTVLPSGRYDVVIARGLEYRILKTSVEVIPGATTESRLQLQRWTDMPTRGWYSGDTHIHYARADERDNELIRDHARAEDVHVASILQMGNIGTVHYRQFDWGTRARYGAAPYTLVPGQEDPRTLRLGHTSQLNIAEPVRNPQRYYLYHEVFEAVRQLGGLRGYVHLGLGLDGNDEYPGTRAGMALVVPYGLLDFVEVAPTGSWATWLDFLNLGYRLPLAAGSDYPYEPIPGFFRTYVEVGERYSVQGWFDGLKAGRTFVTNGPMLEFSIDGHDIGSEINVAAGATITVRARASNSPDSGPLGRMDLYRDGDVVASAVSKDGARELRLTRSIKADHSSWFFIRVQGDDTKRGAKLGAIGATSPIYVSVNRRGVCKPSAVPAIVDGLKSEMRQMLVATAEDQIDLEQWETREPQQKYWPENRRLLQARVEETYAKYDELAARAARGLCRRD